MFPEMSRFWRLLQGSNVRELGQDGSGMIEEGALKVGVGEGVDWV